MSEQPAIGPSRSNRSSYKSDEERRQQIIAATWRVICREGVSAASLRTISAEMNSTTGLLTRYFPEKQGLLLAALEQAAGFLSRDVEAASAIHIGMARVEAAGLAALPLTPERLQAWQVWVAFIGELTGRPELARAHAVFPDKLRQTLVQGLREAQLGGQIAPETYPPQLADILLNQVTGLGVRGVSDPVRYPAEKLPGLIAPFFARLID